MSASPANVFWGLTKQMTPATSRSTPNIAHSQRSESVEAANTNCWTPANVNMQPTTPDSRDRGRVELKDDESRRDPGDAHHQPEPPKARDLARGLAGVRIPVAELPNRGVAVHVALLTLVTVSWGCSHLNVPRARWTGKQARQSPAVRCASHLGGRGDAIPRDGCAGTTAVPVGAPFPDKCAPGGARTRDTRRSPRMNQRDEPGEAVAAHVEKARLEQRAHRIELVISELRDNAV